MPDESDATFAARLRSRPAAVPVADDSTMMLAPAPPLRALAALPEKWIGRYQIRQLLGEGGMGSVYLAEQHEPVERLVALKLMRSTLAGPAAMARFSAERQDDTGRQETDSGIDRFAFCIHGSSSSLVRRAGREQIV